MIGLIAHIVGTPLQDEIARTTERLLRLGAIFSPSRRALVVIKSPAGPDLAQTARALGLDPKTIATWLAPNRFAPRRSIKRSSILDPFKGRITRLLDAHPLLQRSADLPASA
jgi:hypothetical protein